MSDEIHITMINICPELFDMCENIKGKRVTITYKNGRKFEGFIRRTSNLRHIIFLTHSDGIIKMPIDFIKEIKVH